MAGGSKAVAPSCPVSGLGVIQSRRNVDLVCETFSKETVGDAGSGMVGSYINGTFERSHLLSIGIN